MKRKPESTILAESRANAAEVARYAAERILQHFDPIVFHDTCEHFASIETGEDTRLVAYGFNARTTIDVLVLEIGTGAREGIVTLDVNTADVYLDTWSQYPIWSAYRILRERVLGWLNHPNVAHRI